LTRVGATKRPAYRVIAIDKRRSRDGRALEILGYYDPLTEPATVHLESDRIQAWIGKGAQPSDTVVKLMRQAEKNAQAAAAGAEAEKPKRTTRPTKPKTSKKAAAKAEAAPADAQASPDVAVEPAADTAPTEGGTEGGTEAGSAPAVAAEEPAGAEKAEA
jgi:small subunit ribosomal protein S16